MKKFSKSYAIDFYQVGADKKLSLYALMNMIQDIASDHAQVLGFGHDQMGPDFLWVLVRQKLVMSSWPGWGEEISIETFISKKSIGTPPRCILIYHKGQLIGEAITSWLVLDKKTRKVATHKMELILDASIDEECPVEAKKINLSGLKLSPHKNLTVQYSDLDMNFHVNNAIYGQWLINCLSLDIIRGWDLAEFAINYLQEIHCSQQVVISSVATENGQEHEVFFEGRVEEREKAAFTASIKLNRRV